MNAVAMPPEADLNEVAAGDFSGLAMPMLVAARDDDQFRDFVWKSGLVCSNVRRLNRRMVLTSFPENKVLLVLPGAREDAETAMLIDCWCLELDRYTCEVENVPSLNAMLAGILALVVLMVLGGLVSLTFKS